MEEFLKTLGFQKDETAPVGVNRWDRETGSYPWYGTYCSITLDKEGTKTEYGFITFYNDSQMKEKRKFECSLSEEDVKVLLNPDSTEFPFKVVRYPWSKFN